MSKSLSWVSKVLLSLSLVSLVAACGDDSRQKIEDQTSTNEPQEFPQATGEWREARIFKIDGEPSDGSSACQQIDFRVSSASGTWTHTACDSVKTGQLTAEEFSRVDQLVTAGYSRTTTNICPEIFRYGQYYTSIDSDNGGFDRNFDPDRSCYGGDDAAADNLKSYMQRLSNRYESATGGGE